MNELSVESLLSVAIAIEANGVTYYRQAAATAPPEMRNEFLHLAEIEDGHMKKFELIKADLTPEDKIPAALELTPQQEKYFHCLVNNSAFIAPGGAPRLTGNETMQELLEKAIDDEKDTVVFYQCLRSVVKDDKLLAVLSSIIDEEITHIFDLTSRLETL